MTYRPDSKDRKILYLLGKLGVELKEPTIHRIVYSLQKKGARFDFEFTVKKEEKKTVFSGELSERLIRLANNGYLKQFIIVDPAYQSLYIYVYKISEKGAGVIGKPRVSAKDIKIIDEAVKRIHGFIKKEKAKQALRKEVAFLG